MESDREYFARRAREERDAARKAATDQARRAHQAIAEGYSVRAGELGMQGLVAA